MGQHSVVGNGEQQRRNGNASEPGTAAPEERGVGWRIAATSLLTFAAYLAIGLPMAVLPGYVAHDLGAYSLFLDVSLWLAGPVAGAVASRFSYADVYLLGALCAGTAAVLSAALYRRRR